MTYKRSRVIGKPIKGSRGSRVTSPLQLRVWARAEFHRLRRSAGLTGRQAAKLFGRSTSAFCAATSTWPKHPGRSLIELRKHLDCESVRELPQGRPSCPRRRPCPYVSCRHHLYLDVTPSGGIKLNFPGLEPWEIPVSCSLDAAGRDGMTLEEISEVMNMTRERVRQMERDAMKKLRRRLKGCREVTR